MMRITLAIAVFWNAIVADNLSACPPAIQNTLLAMEELSQLRRAVMDTDDAGRVVALDLSEQDAVVDDTLKVVRHLPHLRDVNLIYCPIGADGVKQLVGLQHLEVLDLYGTYVDDEAMAHIGKLKSLKSLNVVPFPRRPSEIDGSITDRGLSAICELSNLETLRISGTFTDDGLRKLTALNKLRTLEISSDGLTETRLKWLSELLPDVEIQ